MKKNLMKKVFAVSLSIAMACSFLPATNPVTASAAAPYVGLRTTFKTLKVNQSTKMTLKNNSLNWQVSKVTTSAKAIATVYGKDKKAATFNIKGKSVGRATIKATLKTAARKTKNTKTVSCRVKVVADETPVTPSETEATVKTQAELETAIKGLSEAGNKINKITIATDAEENFTIPAGSFLGVDLVVDAPKSDVTNNATFRTIEIKAIKDTTWTENATGNKFTVSALSARIVVASGASVDSIVLNKADAAVAIVVDGTLANLTISQKAAVAISGTTNTRIAVAVNATDAALTTSRPVDVKASVKAVLVFEKGAEDSKVEITSRDVTVTVDNRTDRVITVTKADGTEQTVDAGTKADLITLSPGTPVNPSTPGSSTTVTKAAIAYIPASAPTISSATATVSDGAVDVISSGSITLAINASALYSGDDLNVKEGNDKEGFESTTISAGAFEYRVTVNGKTVSGWTDLSKTNNTCTFDVSNFKNGASVMVYVRIKESATTQASGQISSTYKATVVVNEDKSATVTF